MGWEVTAEGFIAELDQLGANETLDVRINSIGGSVFEGLSIYNRLLSHKGQVDVTIEGLAASMGSVIAMAGNTVTMYESSLMMIHNPATAAFGDPDDMRKVADTLDKIKDILLDAYASKSSLERNTISNMMDAETWMTPTEAFEGGFITAIAEMDGGDDLDIAASLASLDLSRFKKKPTIAGTGNTLDNGNGQTTFKFVLLDTTNPENTTQVFDMKRYHVVQGSSGLVISETPEDADRALASFVDKAGAEDFIAIAARRSQPDNNTVDADEIRNQALAEDQERRTGIRQVFARHNGHDALMTRCLDGDGNNQPASIDDARALLLEAIGARQASEGDEDIRVSYSVVEDGRDKFVNAATDSLLSRAGVREDNMRNEYRSSGLRDIAKMCAERSLGTDIYGMNLLQIIGAAFSHSTSDFPLMLENVLNKVMLASYNEFPSTYQDWCRIGSVNDFRANPRLSLGSFNNLDTVLESGEFKETTVGEQKETIQALTKGNIFAVTRQLIINDDMDFLSMVAGEMGLAARRTVNADLYALLALNTDLGPTMLSDATAMFDASHNNLAGSGAAISVATVSAGKAAMRTQTFDANSDAKLNIRADHLLVPVALESAALEFVQSTTDPSQANSRKPNIHQGTLNVISDPEIDDVSATGWYLASNQRPNFEVSFLDGNDTPFLDSEEGFSVDGVRWKVRLDYAVGGIEYRSMWHNPGA